MWNCTWRNKAAISFVSSILKRQILKMSASPSPNPPATAATQNENVSLSDEQRTALDAVKRGCNVFITGSAGVGKSFLLQQIIKSLPKSSVYVTASTGVAACNIDGQTLHSFASIGLGDKPATVLAYTILQKGYKMEAKKRWLNCRVLVVDEISMIDGNLFSKVDEVARIVRRNNAPFGGIQLILCGDFLQLPPVNVLKFAFETDAWKKVVSETIVLKKVFRQKLVGFVSLLNRLRLGRITPLDIEVLLQCSKTTFPDDGIKPTRLFPHKYACDQINRQELAKLPGKPITYTATDWSKDEAAKDILAKNCRYCKELQLKVGAQVMLLNNQSVSSGLVNGARGVITGFHNRKKELEDMLTNMVCEEGLDFVNTDFGRSLIQQIEDIEVDCGFPIVKFVNDVQLVIANDQIITELAGKKVFQRTQLPLALAWAVSVHKSQGMTLERIDIDIAKAFEHGQAYVALSRVTSLDGLLLRDFDASKVTAHPHVLEYYKRIDPSFDGCTNGGEQELRDFIERRKHPERFRNEKPENITPDARVNGSSAVVDLTPPKTNTSDSICPLTSDSLVTTPLAGTQGGITLLKAAAITPLTFPPVSFTKECHQMPPHTPTRSKSHLSNNSFLNSICPDLLVTASQEGRNKRKRASTEVPTDSVIVIDSDEESPIKREQEAHIKTLLIERSSLIEEKRRKALARRYLSSRQQSMNT